MYETVVAIDLETTGIDPFKDHIIEIGAAVYAGGGIVTSFSELAKSPVALAPGIIQLTGITPEMLNDARPLGEVLADFLAFLPEDCLCIAHNSAFDKAFLAAATKNRFDRILVDTVGLSRICFPFLASHGLESLRETLQLPSGGSHRALADCEVLLQLWQKILEQAYTIPLPIVSEINFLLAGRGNHPYRDFFRKLEGEILTRGFGRHAQSLEELFNAKIPQQPQRRHIEEEMQWQRLEVAETVGLFENGGKLSQAMNSYEYREGQGEMVRKVCAAFNNQQHLLVEAGTGIGKSLAYLVPSILWSKANDVPVVVSTNTKNLQTQLFEKDLPLIRQALGLEFKSAIIKGRRNYLCLRKMTYLLRQAAQELDAEERMRMLNILPWAVWSETGDISENIVYDRPGFGAFWAKLSTIGDECLGKGCPHQKRCFLRRARARAAEADIVVANHSLVFADINMKNPAMPPHAQLVFDEAHNLEAAATRHLSVELSYSRYSFCLGRLSRSGKKNRRTGLLPSIEAQMQAASSADKELREHALARLSETMGHIDLIDVPLTGFFDALKEFLSRSEGGRGPVRFSVDRKIASQWESVTEARETLFSALAEIMRGLESLCENLKDMNPDTMPYQVDFIRDLEASVQWLREITEDTEFVLDGSNDNYVYWIESAMDKHGGARAWAAPRSVGALLHDQVYSRKRSVIFCSATFSVRKSFDFLKKRLGLSLVEPERLLELNAGTPFDYKKQSLVVVPLFLPEPGERGKNYAEELADLLAEVYRRTQGRGLALFTSYDMLKTVAQKLEKELLGDGIQILAQGSSGSRENITTVFKNDIHSVLLGTHSFWEGVDVVGEALSCLTIARLPFAVFTDPINEARCEQVEAEGGNAFLGYSLPSAVIRFRQGFGRLIRHKTDRGVVIVTDRRIIAKRYGSWFRESVPAPLVSFPDRDSFLAEISRFIDGGESS
jgi:ATP-dependent DNA helicase DinG